MADDFTIGAEIEVPHPFIRDTFRGFDADGPFEQGTWRPGTRFEQCAPDDYEAVADAIGQQIATIVGLYKPGRFPARVFFTRRWRDPNGREFGKGKLRILTIGCFRQLVRGYRHEFRLLEPKLEMPRTKPIDRESRIANVALPF